jgi:pimeloyl-ACP methyl ester carboxylesterase
MKAMSFRRSVVGVAVALFPFLAPKSLADAPIGSPPPGFVSDLITTDSGALHYVRGGNGPAVVLLHGFPEDWAEYRAILPRLGKTFTLVAFDLPGMGHSAPSVHGYAASALADQIHDAVAALKLQNVYLIGHDLGGIVAYAYVRRFPSTLRGAMIVDVPVPGVAGWEESTRNLWHIGFIQAPEQLAEKLVDWREAAFLGWCYDQGRFNPAERAYYAQEYGPAQTHAAFEIYRALPRDAQENAAETAPNATPLAVLVGEKSFFRAYQQTFLTGFQAKGMTRVESAVVVASGHYVAADNPDGLAEMIERFAAH